MTREEYLQLVAESVSFKEMDEETKKQILAAEGQDMETYGQLFTEEKVRLNEAWKELQKNNEEVIKKFAITAKATFLSNMKKREASEKKVEENEAENLLTQI